MLRQDQPATSRFPDSDGDLLNSIDHLRLQRPPGIQQDGAGHVSNRNGPVGGLGVYERLFEAHCLLEMRERICIISPVGGQLTRRHLIY